MFLFLTKFAQVNLPRLILDASMNFYHAYITKEMEVDRTLQGGPAWHKTAG